MHSQNRISVTLLLFALLASGCLVQTAPQAKSLLKSQSLSLPAPQNAAALQVDLSGCKLALVRTYFWRDWQPTAAGSSSDGGSPLYTSAVFSLANPSDLDQEITWQGHVQDSENNLYPINFTNRDQEPMIKINLPSGVEHTINLVANDGPHLPTGTDARLLVQFKSRDGSEALIATDWLVINKTN